ncbi:MAG: DMT family transporter [Candidatus Odinarchaeota archaeon]
MTKISRKNGIIAVTIATFSVSFAPILVRLSQSPAQVIAFYRLGIASLITISILTFLSGVDSQKYPMDTFRKISLKDWLLLVISGFFLAIHFYSWMLSIKLTTVALSTLFVDTSPLFVIIVAFLFLNEKINMDQLAGIICAFLGVVILIGPGLAIFTAEDLLGIAMSLIGAVTVAFYVVIGRSFRANMGMWHYTVIVYSSCAFWLLVINIPDLNAVTEAFILPRELVIFILLAVLGSILGHSIYNYALKYLKGSTVSICFLGEAVAASVYAVFLFSEIPSWNIIVGGAVMLTGIVITIYYENRTGFITRLKNSRISKKPIMN